MRASISERTRRGGYDAYATEWRRFAEEKGVPAGEPPVLVVLQYLERVHERTRAGRTVGKARAALEHWAAESGFRYTERCPGRSLPLRVWNKDPLFPLPGGVLPIPKTTKTTYILQISVMS